LVPTIFPMSTFLPSQQSLFPMSTTFQQ
jgi:hypothetical protein